jgi:restriction system protein
MDRAWLVRAGRHGERETLALSAGLVLIGWSELPDLSSVQTREGLAETLREAYPDASVKRLRNHLAQLWMFRNTIAVGDLVALPLKGTPAVAIGRIAGAYQHRADLPEGARHTRPVEWLTTDVPRTAIGQDLLYTLGAFLTVCEIKRNNGAQRVAALAAAGKDPGWVANAPGGSNAAAETGDDDGEMEAGNFDVVRYAADAINAWVTTNFAGHGLARLVQAVFTARSMVTWRAPEGPDAGIDLLVGSGPLGMDAPRIVVQVKSSQSPVDVGVIRELQGVVGRIGGDQGLLVAWGGLTKAAEREVRQQFFSVRVWTADDLVREFSSIYDQLPDEIQVELPLRRVWTLAVEEE